MEIDIVTTSTLRHEILDKTLKSFRKNLFTDIYTYRYIINIDPVGDNKRSSSSDVLKIAYKYFDNVVVNEPMKPNFARAVIWCWSQIKNKYVFNLEDDWVLRKKINIKELTDILERYEDVMSLRIPQKKIAGERVSGNYLQEKDRKLFHYFSRISLNPTLFRGSELLFLSNIMDSGLNPESQLVPYWSKKKGKKELYNFMKNKKHTVYIGAGEYLSCSDIGRDWRAKMRIVRKPCFTRWGK